MAEKIGSMYFGHPEKKTPEGHKETVYLGTVFENRFDPNDNRKDLSLSLKQGDRWLRASSITYGKGDDAVTVDIPEGAFVKVRVGKGSGGGSTRQPDRF